MSCEIKEKDGKLEGVLIFKREELLYDIKNYAYIEGSVMETDNSHRRHTVQDVGEEGNIDRVTRVLNLAFSKCRELLYPYSKHELRRRVVDDRLREPDVYGIVLSLPPDFSQTTLSYLGDIIHEYLVSKAVGEWLRITYPEKYQLWEDKSKGLELEIKVSSGRRIRGVKRRMHPF